MNLPPIFKLIGILAFVVLGSCSNAPVDTTGNSVIKNNGAKILSILKGRPAGDVTLTRQQLSGYSLPLLWIEVPSSGAAGSAVFIGENADAKTWITANAVTLITKDGLVFGTRGLGPDLLASDLTQAKLELKQFQSSEYQRDYSFIQGDESVRTDSYYCESETLGQEVIDVLDIAHNTFKVRETCFSIKENFQFTNLYWIGGDGTVWSSTQWAGKGIGYLKIQKLI